MIKAIIGSVFVLSSAGFLGWAIGQGHYHSTVVVVERLIVPIESGAYMMQVVYKTRKKQYI